MISKELFSEIFKVNINEVESVIIDGDDAHFIGKNLYLVCDVYKLAHKGKEWALSKDIKINSRLNGKDNNGYAEAISKCELVYSYYKDTEPEAIFKVCQWILENKETK